MTVSLPRRAADLTCRAIQRMLPAELEAWGWAVRAEVADIDDDFEALLFALDGCRGLLAQAVLARLFPLNAAPQADALSPYPQGVEMIRKPRVIGLISATAAVLLGILYMLAAGAPFRYLAINGAALLIGFALLAIADRSMLEGRQRASAFALAGAGALLATALLGEQIDGAARWVKLGPIVVQPSLILLPAMIVAFARSRDALSTSAMVVAAVSLAVQPDRAMASVLMVTAAVVAIRRPDHLTLMAVAGSIAGFGATLAQGDTLPAAPYVDQIFYSSFDVHPLAGAAVLVGTAFLLVPAIMGWLHDRAHRDVYLVLGTVWLAAILAAALGNYPTPLVGYGGSAIIGYVLCLYFVSKRAGVGVGTHARSNEADAQTVDQDLRLGLPISAS